MISNNIKIILTLNLLIFSINTKSQVYEIENIKHFSGTCEIPGFGYAAFYEKNNSTFVEILDKNLVLKSKTKIEKRIDIFIKGYYNDSTILIVSCNKDAETNTLISFDYSGKFLRSITHKKKIGKILPCKNKGYFIINAYRKKKQIMFLSNTLITKWELDTDHWLPTEGFDSQYLTKFSSGSLSQRLSGLLHSSESALVWLNAKNKRWQLEGTINCISSDGKKLFEYNLENENEKLIANIIHGNFVYLFTGIYNKRKMQFFSEDIFVKKLNMAGEIIEEKKVIGFFNGLQDSKKYQFHEFIKTKDQFILSNGFARFSLNTDTKNEPTGLNYFDQDMNFIEKKQVIKAGEISPISGTLVKMIINPNFAPKNYCFVTRSKDGLNELVVYTRNTNDKYSIHVASTDNGKNYEVLSDVGNPELKNDQKNDLFWIEILPSNQGEAVLITNSSKYKKISFHKIQLE